MTLTTAVLTEFPSIAALVPEWDALSQRDPHSTPYQTGSLTVGIGNLFPGTGTPYIVTARASNGELVGVLPLRRIRSKGRLGGHGLTPYTEWHASYFDSVLDPAYPEAGDALHAAIRARRDWDRCDFRYLRPESHLMQAESSARANSDGGFQSIYRHAYAEHTSANSGGPHKAAKRFSRVGELVFTAAEPHDQIGAAVRRFSSMHTSRWMTAGGTSEFADPQVIDGLTALLSALSESRMCRVGTLRLSGEIVAVHCAFQWKGVQFSWRMAHDAQWQVRSPGRLLMSLMIEAGFASGCSECDLGRGEGGYKQRWPTEERPLTRLTARGSTWRGRFAALRGRR